MALNNLLLGLAGFNVTGDVGPLTVYRSRRRALVFYPRMPALNPPSTLQLIQRNRWTTAAILWRAALPATRADWEAAAQKARLMCTGYNLWVYHQCTGDDATLRTITRNTGIGLVNPP